MTRRPPSPALSWVLAACLVWLSACTAVRVTQLTVDPDAGSGPDVADSGVASTQDAGAQAGLTGRCGDVACACEDGVDNDRDGLIDGNDPECTGAFDDDEASFGIGKPNKQGQCRDCFWDDNAGNGDDDCRYAAECLQGSAIAASSKGNCASCQVSDACIDNCRARTPNGCDCFGCCEVISNGVNHIYVELTESCTLDRISDETVCPRCVQNSACQNPCGRCELCLGKHLADLPADCVASEPGGTAYTCEDGQQVCAITADCVGASYCYLGCCLVDLL